jgi:hypothetical protein
MKTATPPKPTPEALAAVVDSLIPKSVTSLGKKLVPLKAGHQLLISQIGHPLATGKPWEDSDVLLALFVFSRPSPELFALLAEDQFEAEFFAFVESIPAADIPGLAADMAAHWIRNKACSGAVIKTPPRQKSRFRAWLKPLGFIVPKN